MIPIKGKLLFSPYFFLAGAAAGAGAATTLSKRAVRAISFCKLSIEEMMNFTCEWGKLLWSAIALMEFKLFQW